MVTVLTGWSLFGDDGCEVEGVDEIDGEWKKLTINLSLYNEYVLVRVLALFTLSYLSCHTSKCVYYVCVRARSTAAVLLYELVCTHVQHVVHVQSTNSCIQKEVQVS